MLAMAAVHWERVVADDFAVPDGRPLAELTAELTRMLGSPDPELRDGVALPVLATWVERGVYDDLLGAVGDGMAAGLAQGLGERDTDSVLRRSFSALVLGVCIDRDSEQHVLPSGTVLGWGDRLMTWWLREQDTRGFVPGRGWAHAIAHGADALAALARSPEFGGPELLVILDVIRERLSIPGTAPLLAGEPDRIAFAAMAVLHRPELDADLAERWLGEVAQSAELAETGDADPYAATVNAEAFLRSLHLQLLLGPEPPPTRADLLLAAGDALRRTNSWMLAARQPEEPVTRQ